METYFGDVMTKRDRVGDRSLTTMKKRMKVLALAVIIFFAFFVTAKIYDSYLSSFGRTVWQSNYYVNQSPWRTITQK